MATLSGVDVTVIDRVSSGRDCVIDRATLSAVSVTVLLPGLPCQQWT